MLYFLLTCLFCYTTNLIAAASTEPLSMKTDTIALQKDSTTIHVDVVLLTELAHHLLKNKWVCYYDYESIKRCSTCNELFILKAHRSCPNCSLHELLQLSFDGITYIPGTDMFRSSIQNNFTYTIRTLSDKKELWIHPIFSLDPPSLLNLARKRKVPSYLQKLMRERYIEALRS